MKTSLLAPSRRRQAFSLLEIMVAVSLLATIIVGLLAMFYQTQRAFRSGVAQTDVLDGGRIVMGMLTRELQELTAARVSTEPNLLAAVHQNTVKIIQGVPGGLSRVNEIQDVSFLTRVNDEWVGIAYRVTNSNAGMGTLYRLTATANSITNSFGAPGPHPNVALLSELVTEAALNGRNYNTNFHRVADGVIHLRLLAYDTNGVLIISNNIPDVQVGEGYIFANQALPAHVDLELGILEPKAVEQFKARLNAAEPTQKRARDFLTNRADRVHFFKRRIPIRTVQ